MVKEDVMSYKLIAVGAAILCLLAIPFPAAAVGPMETIKKPIDDVIAILNDPQYKAPDAHAAQREAIWKTVKPMFDFTEISMRAVARYWRTFSAKEKTDFVDVFAQFLGNTYIDKIQGEYHNEKIIYLDQELYQDRYAEVRTKILRESVEIPVNYRLIKEDGGLWKVYDIIVEGVSLVGNYRTQFASILEKESPTQLIQLLNDKLKQQDKRLTDNG